MTDNTSTMVSEVPGVIVLTPFLQELLRLGGVIDWAEYLRSVGAEALPSPGFITFTVNSDKAKIHHLHYITPEKLSWAVMVAGESRQVEIFIDYLAELKDKRVLVASLIDGTLAKLVKPSDSSRYFPGGRKRIKGKIFKRLGRWFNCPGFLLSLTFDPSKISRADAWKFVGKLRSKFIDRVNQWRKRHGYTKARFIPVIEAQPGTGYPHIHFVFPYLRWLAPLDFLTKTWAQAENSVDMKYKDSISPVSYVCKYISKLEGWSDLALSYIWTNRTRAYSLSRDYTLPDYSDKRVPEWEFKGCMSRAKAIRFVHWGKYETLLGADDLIAETPQQSYESWAEDFKKRLKNGEYGNE